MSGTKRKKKRMRLPAGIGSVHKVDGKNRRKPYRARVQSHIEFDEVKQKAVRKYIILGYYETEADAIEALFEYRKNPYTLDAATYTFADVFKMWSEKKYPSLTISGQRGYNSAFKNSTPLHNMKMKDIRATHLDHVMQNIEGGRQLQARLKTFWGLLFKYALEYDIIQKNYADFVKTRDKDTGTTRTAISKEDRIKLWEEADNGNLDAKIALIYIYTGMRPSELLEIPKANVDLQSRIMVGGKKTEAGKDRRIPIHTCILPFVEELMQQEGEMLIMREVYGKLKSVPYMFYAQYRWTELMKKLGMEYTMHYTRHTCATMMREANIAEDLRKLILGHRNADITNRYTHHPDEMLVEAIEALPSRE